MPSLVRIYSKFQEQPLQSIPAASSPLDASFQINGVHVTRPRAATACPDAQCAGLDAVSFSTHVVDINQPHPFVPNFAFSFQVHKHFPHSFTIGFLTPTAVDCRRCRAGRFCVAALRLLSLPPLLGGSEQHARQHRQPAHMLRFYARAPRVVAASPRQVLVAVQLINFVALARMSFSARGDELVNYLETLAQACCSAPSRNSSECACDLNFPKDPLSARGLWMYTTQ